MSTLYKKLNLDRSKLIFAITNYCQMNGENNSISDFEKKDNTRNRVSISIDSKHLYIDFHFNGDGTTTIEDFGGAEVEIKKEICAYIKETCELDESSNSWFVVDHIDSGDFEAIIQLIKESQYFKCIIKEDFGKNMYQYKGIYDDKITISYYTQRTNKVVLMGRPLLLYQYAKDILCNLLDLDQLTATFSVNYNINIPKDVIEEQTKVYLEHSYDKLGRKLLRTMHQAVYCLNMAGDMFDYTYLTFSAYRGLEGHLRYVLSENGIILPGTSFHIFDDAHKLMEKYKTDIHNKLHDPSEESRVINYIEETYKYFGDKRHAYFHWNNPNAMVPLDDTPTINDLSTARSLIRETLEFVDKYFIK